ncbi:hypothetical protein ACWV95_28275 [Streptomyces albus]
MPLTPEEPEIYESVPGTRASAGASRTPQASRTAAPVPGPRPAPRPAPPRTDSKGPNTPGRPNAPRQGNSPAQPKPGAQAKAAAKAQIQLVAATDATAVEVADETVDKLLDEGRSPGDILLLTTGAQHPWAEHELSFGETPTGANSPKPRTCSAPMPPPSPAPRSVPSYCSRSTAVPIRRQRQHCRRLWRRPPSS